MSDFSLMGAIECGIVKLPRVPVAENIPGDDMPMFRNLWENIRKDMPRKGRGKAARLDPLALPTRLLTALEALDGHYEKTFRLWEEEKIAVPPWFIVVCNNTSTSELVYDYISGFRRQNDDGSSTFHQGRLALFQNFDQHGNPLPRPDTLLIDSEQLESSEALDDDFRDMAADEIERFRQEIVERTGDRRAAESLSDQELLREVMNTVGRQRGPAEHLARTHRERARLAHDVLRAAGELPQDRAGAADRHGAAAARAHRRGSAGHRCPPAPPSLARACRDSVARDGPRRSAGGRARHDQPEALAGVHPVGMERGRRCPAARFLGGVPRRRSSRPEDAAAREPTGGALGGLRKRTNRAQDAEPRHASTRARDRLLVTGVTPASEFLQDLSG
jgi:hypothetical protein